MFIHINILYYCFFITDMLVFLKMWEYVLSIMEIKYQLFFYYWKRKSKQRSKDLSVLTHFYTHTPLFLPVVQYEPVKVSFQIISINLILQLNLLQSCQILLFIEDKIIFNCLWVEKLNNLWWYLEKRYLEIFISIKTLVTLYKHLIFKLQGVIPGWSHNWKVIN